MGLCARLLKRPGSCKAYLFALSVLTRFALKGAASEPLLACAPSKRIGASEVQGSYAPDYCDSLGPSVSNVPAWHTGEVPASAT